MGRIGRLDQPGCIDLARRHQPRTPAHRQSAAARRRQARGRGDQQPDDLPEGPREGRRVRRAAPRPRRAQDSGGRCDPLPDGLRHPLGVRRADARVRGVQPRRRPRLDRGRPAHRTRQHAHHGGGKGPEVARRPAERAHQDPGDRGRHRLHRGRHGCRRERQRDPHLRSRPLRAGDERLPHRARAG